MSEKTNTVAPATYAHGFARRRFLEFCGLGAASTFYPHITAASDAVRFDDSLDVDVVIIGGGLGGCAAALAATRMGKRVLLTEPTDWIGGQLSQQGVPPDEHAHIETHGSTASYRQFREQVRDYYRDHYPLTEAAKRNPRLNPGNGNVSRLCHEPRVAVAVLDAMLAPAVSAKRLTVLLNTKPIHADVDGDRVRSVTLVTDQGEKIHVSAPYFIDASEQGDLLPLTNTEYVTGAESRHETGESHAPENAEPDNIQAFTWCFAIDHIEGADHTIDKPDQYDFWKDYTPELTPPWPGKLLSLKYSKPNTLKPHDLAFVPPTKNSPPPKTKALNLWLYRRIIDPANFLAGTYDSGVTIVNWPQNDYMLGNLMTGNETEIAKHLQGARQLSLSLLYWLQTEAPRPDGGVGWKGLRLRNDIMGTADGLAKYPYIRESRRIQAEFTILEQHLSRADRQAVVKNSTSPLTAAPFHDTVGIGYYHLDLHPSSGGDNYIDFASVPFQIPLGSLIPQRIENLIAGCKNIGTTHLSNGCYRLHPVEWSIGEAAGALAAHCLDQRESPRGIRNQSKTLSAFQSVLKGQGFELVWPT
ncbi:Glucose-inhibited division protein A-related protein [Rhodopirellula maiorica SM1]|uniref:Glucose-inhibited division protein A-related protein n=1 Tax=Rhodopirellula maiorica SM1 TaxID=1265738 RepID=M5RL06_9BACT|nr:FAD-dependent oxidoreductase [Rhodopirellula maiorica]EMI16057.1 Glucose-inhibited division protein A-related protein [Rhodopirellula maiorica SM1]